MKNLTVIILILVISTGLSAQKYSSKNGYIGFYSHTDMEDIKADNNQVNSMLDSSTGDVVFLILNKSFHFEKSLMEEHFNENYMETETFPKSTFKGKIVNISEVSFAKQGVYDVTVKGEMNMHGISSTFTSPGTIEVTADGLVAKSKFMIKPEDYGIIIPKLVRENISKEIEVTVNIKYSLLNN